MISWPSVPILIVQPSSTSTIAHIVRLSRSLQSQKRKTADYSDLLQIYNTGALGHADKRFGDQTVRCHSKRHGHVNQHGLVTCGVNLEQIGVVRCFKIFTLKASGGQTVRYHAKRNGHVNQHGLCVPTWCKFEANRSSLILNVNPNPNPKLNI